MRALEPYRDPDPVHRLAAAIAARVTRPWAIMEVCGGQTHAIVRHGLDQLLPARVTLLHGPGCPVCVTPAAVLDTAIALARLPGVVLCTFGDMLRVPGSSTNLQHARADGADVRVVFGPLDALALARALPDRQVVFLAVGFETTAPAVAVAVSAAQTEGRANFSVLVAHVLVPPALTALASDPECRIDGFLAAGHVCAVMGTRAYAPLAARWHKPIVVTGFEPVDLLLGVYHCVEQLEEGRAEVENAYGRAVREDGNGSAIALLDEVFVAVDRPWRGLGTLPLSGLALRPAYAAHDARRIFGLVDAEAIDDTRCQSGLVLQGRLTPPECPHFGKSCTPETPLGATMVSSEGACAAYFRYRRRGQTA